MSTVLQQTADAVNNELSNHATPNLSPHVSVAAQRLPHENEFVHIDAVESSYCNQSVLDKSKYMEADAMHRIRAIATALPRMQRSNDKLAGSISCETIDDVLLHTTSATLVFKNTPKWNDALTQADPKRRPYRYMNDNTAVIDESDGSISHYAIPRKEFIA